MNLTLTRFGGMVGIPAMWEVHVDDQPDAPAWRQLLQRLPWEEVKPSAQASTPDRFSYEVRRPPHTIVLTEPQVQGPWRNLIDRILATHDSQRRHDLPHIAKREGRP